jgi:glycosyltransferase involved in cell wall biosynthesis
MRAVVVDLMCNSPLYSAEFTRALVRVGIDAELASPRFYIEPDLLDSCPRPSWLVDLVVHARRPRPLRLAVRAVEGSVNFLRLLAKIRSGRYDVVHVQWTPFEGRATPFLPMLRWACDRTGALLVYTAHNSVPHDAVRHTPALGRELRAPHLIQALTQHVADELAQEVASATPIVVIPIGPQLSDHALPAKADAAARLESPPPPVVLFQGRIRPYKGLDLLYEAWPKVVDVIPSASLLVVGNATDTQDRHLLAKLRELPSVRIVDRYVSTRELLDYYAVSDLVVFPYRQISQSGALMTAAGLGKPIVVTPLDGFREQVATLRSALVAEEVSGDAIARALIAGIDRRDDLAELAIRDRLAIQESPIGWPSVAAAIRRAYEAIGLASR